MQKCLTFLFLLCAGLNYGQTLIDGTLKDKEGQTIQGVSVMIKELEGDKTLTFSISDREGKYRLSFETPAEKIRIKLSSMGFETVEDTLQNQSQTRDFILKEGVTELREVKLKSSPIRQKGDTINYKVSGFATQSDRSIADVLENMPGITVMEDGQILYQGKPINKFYIENLDLLGGRYNLASENLPHKEVDEVQIYENHQPVKILDSIVFSDRAALNIKLKKEFVITGQAEVGVGIAPFLWDANLTPMIFTKKRQALISYQTTNSGRDLGRQLKSLAADMPAGVQMGAGDDSGWLNIINATPALAQKRYLKNNAHLISLNALEKLAKDFDLRLNVAYLNDYQKQNAEFKRLYYTATDTIPLIESIHNQLYDQGLDVKLRLNQNTKKNYLQDILEFKGLWNSGRGIMMTNNSPLLQSLNDKQFSASNLLSSIIPIGKQMLNLRSNLTYNDAPQQLKIRPGQFEEFLNDSLPYDNLMQRLNLKTFYTDNSVGLTKAFGYFSFSPIFGFEIESKKLETELLIDEQWLSAKDFSNNLSWLKTNTYFNLNSQFNKNKWRVNLRLPFNFQSLSAKDLPLQNRSKSIFILNPNLSLNKSIGNNWNIRGSVGHQTSYGELSQMYPAFILNNYRSLQRFDSPFPKTDYSAFSGGINYKNTLEMFFAHLSYSYNSGKRNLIYETEVLSSGAVSLQAKEKNNFFNGHSFSGEVSKVISPIGTLVRLNFNLGWSGSEMIINETHTEVNGRNQNYSLKLEKKFADWFRARYAGSLSLSQNKNEFSPKQKTQTQNHQLDLKFYPAKNQYVSLSTDWMRSKLATTTTSALFSDLIYRYTMKDVDLELGYSNIFNNKTYRFSSVSSYYYSESEYVLRPWEILLKVRFTL